MSEIRKKGLITTSWIYIGFIIGAFNTFLFARKGFFTPEEYGLSRTLLDIGFLLSSVSSFGSLWLVIKFHPYYEKRLTNKQNDLFSISFFVTLVGFFVIACLTYFMQPLILRKFGVNSSMLVAYFYWTLVFAFGMVFFSLFEYTAWNYGKQVATNVLREIILRLFVTALILLKLFHFISLHQFFILFCFQFVFIAGILVFQLVKEGRIHLTLQISNVSRKFKKQIKAFMFYGIAGSVTGALRVAIDSIVLAGMQGLSAAGIFTLANFAASLLQAPLRSLISITIPLLAKAWKDKNLAEIDRIYKRSAINLLIFSLFIFGCIWLSFEPAIVFLHLDEKYLQGKNVLLILGIMNIIDMGTGVNGQIIGTSTSWRFEFYTNLLLGVMITLLSYTITKYTGAGITGPAFAQLIGVTVYNAIRVIFLKRKFNLMPFTNKTGIAILLFIVCVVPGMLLQSLYPGLLSGILGVLFFLIAMPFGIICFHLSPDVLPIVYTLLKRVGINKKFEK